MSALLQAERLERERAALRARAASYKPRSEARAVAAARMRELTAAALRAGLAAAQEAAEARRSAEAHAARIGEHDLFRRDGDDA